MNNMHIPLGLLALALALFPLSASAQRVRPLLTPMDRPVTRRAESRIGDRLGLSPIPREDPSMRAGGDLRQGLTTPRVPSPSVDETLRAEAAARLEEDSARVKRAAGID